MSANIPANRRHSVALDAVPRIDSQQMNGHGYGIGDTLPAVSRCGILWGRVSVRRDGDGVRLGNGVFLTLDTVPVPWGGVRLYWRCPRCGERVRFLYLDNDGFPRCRRCAGLVYRSSRLAHGWQEMNRRYYALSEQLGIPSEMARAYIRRYYPGECLPVIERRRWMRWAEYDRLCRAWATARRRFYAALMEGELRFFRSIGMKV